MNYKVSPSVKFDLTVSFSASEASFDEVVLLSLFLLGMTLFFRITSYMLYERYLLSNVPYMNDKRVK